MLRAKSLSFLLSLAIPLAAVAVPVLAPSTAFADPAPAAAPVPRTTVSATFQRYLLEPNGRPMGLMLSDGTFVHTGRSLHRDAPALQTGDRLDIEGVVVKTPTGMLIHHPVVRQNGNVIADATQPREHHHEGQEEHAHKHHGKRHALQPVTGAGQVAAIVSGPKGRVRALVLTDGTTAVGHDLASLGLKVGDAVSIAGKGGVYPKGKALRIEKITLPNGQTRDLPPPAHRAPAPTQAPV